MGSSKDFEQRMLLGSSGMNETNETKRYKEVFVGVTIIVIAATMITSTRTIYNMDKLLALHIQRADTFMDPGSRFTAHDGELIQHDVESLENEVSELSLEDKRLQVQIDRLESAVFNGKSKPKLQPYTMEEGTQDERRNTGSVRPRRDWGVGVSGLLHYSTYGDRRHEMDAFLSRPSGLR